VLSQVHASPRCGAVQPASTARCAPAYACLCVYAVCLHCWVLNKCACLLAHGGVCPQALECPIEVVAHVLGGQCCDHAHASPGANWMQRIRDTWMHRTLDTCPLIRSQQPAFAHSDLHVAAFAGAPPPGAAGAPPPSHLTPPTASYVSGGYLTTTGACSVQAPVHCKCINSFAPDPELMGSSGPWVRNRQQQSCSGPGFGLCVCLCT